MKPRHIVILGYYGIMGLGLVGPMEAFASARVNSAEADREACLKAAATRGPKPLGSTRFDWSSLASGQGGSGPQRKRGESSRCIRDTVLQKSNLYFPALLRHPFETGLRNFRGVRETGRGNAQTVRFHRQHNSLNDDFVWEFDQDIHQSQPFLWIDRACAS